MDEKWTGRAFADEVRAEMARQRISALRMQTEVGEGLSSSAYQKYFVQQTRAVPSDVQLAVCRVLGVAISEMWRRAELAAPALAEREEARQHDPEAIAEDALRQLPAASQEAIRAVAADLRPKRDQPPTKRAANGDQ